MFVIKVLGVIDTYLEPSQSPYRVGMFVILGYEIQSKIPEFKVSIPLSGRYVCNK